ncbi:MAG TPA: hypothetical protein VKB95_10350 [Chitinophagaceae bacterium]|nr:hypothetical protein [Chitinophagaceae bacterium]
MDPLRHSLCKKFNDIAETSINLKAENEGIFLAANQEEGMIDA